MENKKWTDEMINTLKKVFKYGLDNKWSNQKIEIEFEKVAKVKISFDELKKQYNKGKLSYYIFHYKK